MYKTLFKLTVTAFALFLNCSGQRPEPTKFVQKFKEFENMLESRIERWDENENVDEFNKNLTADIFSILNAVEMDSEWEFIVDLPDEELIFPGDNSKLYLHNKNNDNKINYYLTHIKLKNVSEDGFWHWFILARVFIHMLPASGHSLYGSIDYILTEEDLQNNLRYVNVVPDRHFDGFGMSKTNFKKLKNMKIEPVTVNVDKSNKKAEIVLYTWNDWVGLTEEHYRIAMKEDNTAEVENIDSKTIVEYNCGIIF